MFDAKQWTQHTFLGDEGIGVNQRRAVTFTVPPLVTVAITTIYYFNADTIDHDVFMQILPTGATVKATPLELDVPALEAVMFVPCLVDADVKSRIDSPLILSGEQALTIFDDTLSFGAVTPIFHFAWLQSKFAGKISDPIVPVGVTT